MDPEIVQQAAEILMMAEEIKKDPALFEAAAAMMGGAPAEAEPSAPVPEEVSSIDDIKKARMAMG